MSNPTASDRATAGLSRVPEDWMPATGIRAFVLEDPILVWLDFHGEAQGFQKDASPYEFTDFIFEKGRQFERKWIAAMAPEAIRVCSEAYEVRGVERFRQTLDLIGRGAPVIAGPALWWAPERVFGVPDLLVQGGWLRKRFPALQVPPDRTESYFVLDLKFTTELDSTDKRVQLLNYAGQVRTYSYIVGELTGSMAERAYLVCRDRIDNPLEVPLRSAAGAPLDPDLRESRDRYLDLKLNGTKYRPGVDPQIEANLANDQDAPWHSAKITIARKLVPGGDTSLAYQIGRTQKLELAKRGIPSLEALLKPDPAELPLESCKGLGAAKCPRVRAVLRANKTGTVTPAKFSRIPPVKPFEFYVDFETFNNLNVDFDRQWPGLEGCEMIFMIGVAWAQEGAWKYQALIAAAEDQKAERRLLQELEDFLRARLGDRLTDVSATTLFHWTSAEVWQLRRACDRQGLAPGHTLRRLPWYDLQKEIFLAEPIGVPGAWGYGLKEVAPALGLLKWPGNLDDGLGASVAGWQAYKKARPLDSDEMKIITEYNEVDCEALYEIVRWLRARQGSR